MQRMHVRYAVGMAIVFLCLAAIAGAQGPETFKIRLMTVPIDFVQAPKVTGGGAATATLTDDTLSIQGQFEGLQGAATAAQVHVGRIKGVRGPVIGELTASKATAGSITGTIKLASGQLDALKAGRLYIQINSEAAPDGNLWGWLLK
jgi:hypothetical protein